MAEKTLPGAARSGSHASHFTVIAHRGASSLAPENTASALRKALEERAEAVEVDVRCTQDGSWVLQHEGEISRHSDGRGEIEELTLDELRQYDFGSWFHPDFAGEKILTLNEACALVLPKANLILDVKTEGPAEKLAKSLLRALEGRPRVHLLISSFSWSLLQAFRRLDPEMPLGYLVRRLPLLKTWLAGTGPFHSVHPRKDVFAPELAEVARRKDLKVYVWTVNRPEEMREVLAQGAHGFFTDFPQRAKALLG